MRSCLALAIISFTASVSAQDAEKDKAKAIVESKEFVFKAQSVQPLGAPSRQLTSEYDLKVLGDSVISYLPYFGRAYSAPAPGEDGGFNFTSTKFEYKAKPKKKGGWDINIKPNDTKDVRQLSLSITQSGYASLQVISNNRQSISYYGYITEK
jgi:hypothetical protein